MAGVDARSDKVFSPEQREAFLRQALVIEEKLDGANLGISFDPQGNLRVQNRGAYLSLPGTGQWKQLEPWLAPKIDGFFDVLADRYLLFGEWCYAQHSVCYDHLPDWFLGFDVYDKTTGQFLSVPRRNALFHQSGIYPVPTLAVGRFSQSDLESRLTTSRVGNEPAEGLYLRFDQGDWLGQRAKFVRAGFIQAQTTHWSRAALRSNQLRTT